jgi:hypothetical protein
MLFKYRHGHETVAVVSMDEMAFPRAFLEPSVLSEPLPSPKVTTKASDYQFILSPKAQVQGIWCENITVPTLPSMTPKQKESDPSDHSA